MKKKFGLFFILFVFILFTKSYSQSPFPTVDSKEYEILKSQGKLNPTINYRKQKTNFPEKSPNILTFDDLKKLSGSHEPNRSPLSNYCNCLVPLDNTFSVAHFTGSDSLGLPAHAPDWRNDDGSSPSALTLPFTFCFYGTNYDSVYINNNGNVTFDVPYGTFSALGFPSNQYVMVAPFWADVDTRSTGSGLVYYKITPTYMIVKWEIVGYYSFKKDKVNTFQLIVTDGADPILPPGNNVAFCYGDMQWTTGSASGGVNGFGGTAANVGVNKGDSINYIQIGRFDQPGAAYDGGYGNNDGVSWLDNKSFYFNACSNVNLPPIVSGFNSCDTLKICGTGDTLVLSGMFLSPENGQTTTIAINLNGTNATILSNTSGNSASAQVMFIATPANAGNNIISFIATDDGVPVGVSAVNVNIYVDTTGISALHPTVSGNAAFCVGDSVQLQVSPTNYDSYIWSNGSDSISTYANSSGEYWVTSTLNGCSQTNFIDVVTKPLPTPLITGNLVTACATGTTILSVDSLIYASYHWSNGSNNDSITVGAGTYSVTVVGTNGCTASSPSVNVISQPPPYIVAHNDTALCDGTANLWVDLPGPTLSATCGLSTTGGCSGLLAAGTIGTGLASCSNFSFPAPFGNEYTSAIQQYLYTAAELNAAGITAGRIDALEFNVTLIDSTSFNIPITTYHNYTIKIGCTNLTTFSFPNSLVTTGLNTVYPASTYNVTTGWNNFSFATAYDWDGVSNIIVQVCFSEYNGASSWTGNCQTAYTTTANYSSQEYMTDQQGVCTNQMQGFYQSQQEHPDIKFHYCVAPNLANYNYLWTSIPIGSNVADSTSQITSAQPSGAFDYVIKVSNNMGGCPAFDTVHVSTVDITTMHFLPKLPYCVLANNDTLKMSVPIGTGGSFSGPGIVDNIYGIFSPSSAGVGNHTVHYTVTTGHCGTGDTSIVLTVVNQLDPTINQIAPTCSSSSPITLVAATAGGSWSGNGITDTINGIFDPTLPGLVGFDTVAYTIYTPCYSRDTMVIHVVQQLDASINPHGNPYCTGFSPFNLTSVGSGGTWAGTGITNGISGEFSPAAAGAGTFVISHYLTAFCGDTATTSIRVEPAPVVSFTAPDTSGCQPIIVNFNASSSQTGGTYFWDFGDGNTSTTSAINLNPSYVYSSYHNGVPYTVTFIYTDTLGCADTSVHAGMVIVFSQPEAIFRATPQPTDITNPEIFFVDHSLGIINNWTWSFGITGTSSTIQNPSYVYPDTGTYQVQLLVVNNNGCKDSTIQNVIIDPITTCFIPSAFTPDANGNNEEFKVYGNDVRTDGFEMSIFDRWGERMFHSSDLFLGWNGSKNNSGQTLKQDVYVYKIDLKDFKGLKKQFIGQVTLVR